MEQCDVYLGAIKMPGYVFSYGWEWPSPGHMRKRECICSSLQMKCFLYSNTVMVQKPGDFKKSHYYLKISITVSFIFRVANSGLGNS